MGDREMTARELLAMTAYYGSVIAAVFVTLWLMGVPLWAIM